MAFNAMPMSREDRKKQQLAHAQRMMNIINSLGSFSETPLPKYDYGGRTQQIGNDISKDFAATLLLASGGGGRTAAMQRRLKRN